MPAASQWSCTRNRSALCRQPLSWPGAQAICDDPCQRKFQGQPTLQLGHGAAMLNLYRHAAPLDHPQLRRRWVHLSSEQCAPITNCQSFPNRWRVDRKPPAADELHAMVVAGGERQCYQGVAVEHPMDGACDSVGCRRGTLETNVEAAANRKRHFKYVYLGDGQRRAGALDEYVWAAELERRGLPFDLVGPTYYSFHAHMRGPEVFTTREAVARVAQLAQKRGMYFARKFGYEHAVQSELLNAVRFTARPQGEIATR